MNLNPQDAAAVLVNAINYADAVMIGAGSGLSTAAGFTYSGERFHQLFADFIQARGFTDMYTAGFYTFETLEEQWAYWSRQIWHNRYVDAPKNTYEKLFKLVQNKEYFVLTTNVDHRFQLSGFPKDQLFYTQGDFGLWQCSKPCHQATYDNVETVTRMVNEQRAMRVPDALVPWCPRCGAPMAMNLRIDGTFVEDAGWHKAADRYSDFLNAHRKDKVLYLELGVGMNTPGIVKYPFWHHTHTNPKASYLCVNYGETYAPAEIRQRSTLIKADIDVLLTDALAITQERSA